MSKIKGKKVVHILPVFASTEEGDEPGWLILTRKKASPLVSAMRIEKPLLRWDPPVKSWFVHEDRISDALDAIEFAVVEKVSYCADCKDGMPCSTWQNIPRVDYVVRKPSDLEPPNRARLEYAEDLFEWTQVKAKTAPPPPPPPPPPPHQGPSASSRYGQGQNTNTRGPGAGPRRGHTPPTSPPPRYNPYGRAQPMDPFTFVNAFLGRFFEAIMASPPPPPPPPPRNMEMPPHEAARLLGLPWPCQKDQLAPAFKKAVLISHPDRGGSTEAMAKINVARDVLAKHLGV